MKHSLCIMSVLHYICAYIGKNLNQKQERQEAPRIADMDDFYLGFTPGENRMLEVVFSVQRVWPLESNKPEPSC